MRFNKGFDSLEYRRRERGGIELSEQLERDRDGLTIRGVLQSLNYYILQVLSVLTLQNVVS
jgi:hypothetical protein